MHPVLKHLIDTDFADLAGSQIEGQIALSDDIINQGLHEILAKLRSSGDTASAENTAPASAPTAAVSDDAGLPDPKVLLQKLKIDHLKYRTEVGKTILEIKAGV